MACCRLHNAGIGDPLDVMYSHTVEIADDYVLSTVPSTRQPPDEPERYVQLLNYSGCGSTVAANSHDCSPDHRLSRVGGDCPWTASDSISR
jgi:pullulanase/glycogen debranching enzyme